MKNKYYCGKCEHIGMYTGSYTHSEKLCKRYAAILKVDGNDVEKCVPCICETLEAENAALKERLGKWAVDNEIVMEPRVKDGQTYYVISRKERRIVTHYICTELTPEAAEARLNELQGEQND